MLLHTKELIIKSEKKKKHQKHKRNQLIYIYCYWLTGLNKTKKLRDILTSENRMIKNIWNTTNRNYYYYISIIISLDLGLFSCYFLIDIDIFFFLNEF